MTKDTSNINVDQTVVQFAPLVKRLAYYIMASLPPSVEVDDVIQSGMLGLLDAARRFKDTFGAQFETYAVQRIRGAMLDGLRQSDWLPRSLRKSLRQVETMISKLEQRHGRPPTESELAIALGVSLGAAGASAYNMQQWPDSTWDSLRPKKDKA